MPTLKIIEYKASDKNVDVVVAILKDSGVEMGRITASISPEWTKREALAEVKRHLKKLIISKQNELLVKNKVNELDGSEVEA